MEWLIVLAVAAAAVALIWASVVLGKRADRRAERERVDRRLREISRPRMAHPVYPDVALREEARRRMDSLLEDARANRDEARALADRLNP